MYRYPRARDYTPAAILILFLYLLGWFPGFIVNILKLLIAVWEKDSYEYVSGFGCLIWLLILCGFVPIIGFLLAYYMLMHLY